MGGASDAGLCGARRHVWFGKGSAARRKSPWLVQDSKQIKDAFYTFLIIRHWGMNGWAEEQQKVHGEEERKMQTQKAPFTEEHSHLLSAAFIATAGCILLWGRQRAAMWNLLEGGARAMPLSVWLLKVGC